MTSKIPILAPSLASSPTTSSSSSSSLPTSSLPSSSSLKGKKPVVFVENAWYVSLVENAHYVSLTHSFVRYNYRVHNYSTYIFC